MCRSDHFSPLPYGAARRMFVRWRKHRDQLHHHPALIPQADAALRAAAATLIGAFA